MITADEILKLIEFVAHKDTDQLDRIDCEVSLFFNKNFTKKEQEYLKNHWRDNTQYSRSRDALKAIRPSEISFQILTGYGGGNSICYWANEEMDDYDDDHRSPLSPTEELAELHAIIQAIKYQRSKKT